MGMTAVRADKIAEPGVEHALGAKAAVVDSERVL
jgi:hypothetical protein